MKIVARSFSPRYLVAGDPALDLVNTVTARNSSTPIDGLDGYPRPLEWRRLAKPLDIRTLDALDARARESSEGPTRALARARSE
jgi:hypothetical protein